MFQLDNVSLHYGHKIILSSINLELKAGEFAVIIGPNGAGKSSLLKLITGEVKPKTGSVFFDHRKLLDFSPRELAERRAVLSQSTLVNFPFTVLEIVELGLLSKSRRDIALQKLSDVDLENFEGRFYQDLSGGEQQRVQFARILCQLETSPQERARQFLFLDEPTSSLDIKHQLTILDIARNYQNQGVGVVAVLHDLNLAAIYADRIIVVNKGNIAGNGKPKNILTNNCLNEVFDVSLEVGKIPSDDTPFVLPF